MTDYSTTCPMTFLAEMVEAGTFPKELLDKLKEENSILKVKLSGAMDLLIHGESDDEESESSEDEDSTDLINDLENDLADERGTVRWLKDQLEKAREDLKEMTEEKIKLDKVCETLVKEAEEEEESESEEEEETKYDADDWARCYGFTTKDGEYRMNMAGGGSHWEDYVITRDRNFIHNKDGEKKVKTFISCPESNYVRIVSIGEDYKLEEGETDMYEMVQECFQEEIMEYQEEEEYQPKGSRVDPEGLKEYMKEEEEMTKAERKKKWKEEKKK